MCTHTCVVHTERFLPTRICLLFLAAVAALARACGRFAACSSKAELLIFRVASSVLVKQILAAAPARDKSFDCRLTQAGRSSFLFVAPRWTPSLATLIFLSSSSSAIFFLYKYVQVAGKMFACLSVSPSVQKHDSRSLATHTAKAKTVALKGNNTYTHTSCVCASHRKIHTFSTCAMPSSGAPPVTITYTQRLLCCCC